MAYLEELFDYKNRMMEDLMTNDTIVKLINENVSLEDAGSLIYKQVFPYEYIPDTVEEGHTFICVDVDLLSADNKTFYNPVIYIWEFTHKSKLRLPEGGVRTDKLASEIAREINGSRYYGLGELSLYSMKRFAPIVDFQGKALVFHAKDFNRPFDGKRPTPANRKNW